MDPKTRDEVIALSSKLMKLFLENKASSDEAYRQGWRFIGDYVNQAGDAVDTLVARGALKIEIFEAALDQVRASRIPLSD